MTEAMEVAHSILKLTMEADSSVPTNLDEARILARRYMPDETATVLDNIAWAMMCKVTSDRCASRLDVY